VIVSWNSTNQCNMYCAHCYRGAGEKGDQELSTTEAKALLEEIARAHFKIMIFSGGEPLLRSDIFDLVAHARDLGLRPVFGTNGTLITKEVAQELVKAGALGMGISLDSLDKSSHDSFRRCEGAWDGAVAGMEQCRSAGLRFQIHTTVMGWNDHEIESMTDFAVERGAVAHHIFFLVPTGRASGIEEQSLRAQEYEGLLERILEKQKATEIELKPTCAPQFMRIAKQKGLEMRFSRGCLAGISYCIIGPNGDLQPCAYLDLPIGNVRETPFSELWKNSPVLKKLRTQEYSGGCGHCMYKGICGGCRARAAVYHGGDYMAEEPWCLYQGVQQSSGSLG